MTTDILDILSERATGRLTTLDIWSALRRRGKAVSKADIEPILRELAKAGKIQYDPPGWRLTSQSRNAKSIQLPPGVRGQVIANTDRELPTIQQPIENERLQKQSREQGNNPWRSARVPQKTKRWSTFRSLARYYQDCILMEDAPDLKGYLPSINQQWLPITGRIPWQTLAANGPGFRLTITNEQGVFQRERARRGDDLCLYIGYPVRLVRPTKTDVDPFVVPVFVQAVDADWQANSISMRPDGPAQLNTAWVQGAFRSAAEQDAFQRMVGLTSDVDDDDEGASLSATIPNLAELGIKMGAYLSDKVHGRIVPDALDAAIEYQDLPDGIHNRAVLMLGPRLKFTKSLLRELRAISDEWEDEQLDQTALRFFFPHDQPDGQGEHWPWQSSPPGLSPSAVLTTNMLFGAQHQAVESALSLPLSVITGPPGTGKSEVVRAIMANQLVRGHPTLMASKNHAAIDAVVPRLNQMGDGEPLVIRTSSPDLASRNDWKDQMRRLLTRPEVDRSARIQALIERCAQSTAVLARYARAMKRRIEQKDRFDAATIALENAIEQFNSHSLVVKEESVQWGYEQDTALSDLLSTLNAPAHPSWWQRLMQWIQRKEPRSIQALQEQAIARLPRLGSCNPTSDPTPWKHLADMVKRRQAVTAIEDELRHLGSIGGKEDIAKAATSTTESMTELLKCLSGGRPSQMSSDQKTILHNLRAGIATFGDKKFKSALNENIGPLLASFPLWAVTNLSVRSSIPMSPGIFDLVVIDEASQCDIASIIPLLARARRATIVGDPMQLKHISRLQPQADAQLLQRHGLTDLSIQRCGHRQNSAFDLAASAPKLAGKTLLDVHLRCHDEIAEYAGETFYRGSLHYGTDSLRLKFPKGLTPGIHWTEVVGPIEGATSGASSPSEIDACAKILVDLDRQGFSGTVGIVTPFRHQANRINDRIEKLITPQRWEQWNFLASTAHGFQGDERDLMIYSLCSGPDLAPTSAGWLASEDGRCLVNVAVTRAKAMLHIIGNRSWARQCGIPHIEKLAKWNERISVMDQKKYDSVWEERLDAALFAAGIKTVPQYRVAHRRLDLAVIDPIKIDIEVDGEAYHRTESGRRKDDDHWRDVQITSLGWRVMRFWVYELREDMPGCVNKIMSALSGARPA